MKKGNVLVIYSGWLGDLVWIIPTLHALKSAFNSVSLVVSKTQAPLAEVFKNGLVDELHVDISSKRLAMARQVRRQVRASDIDTVVDLKGRGKTGIYMPWGGGRELWIPHRNDAREYVLSRLVHPLAKELPARADGHMVDAYLSSLAALGVQDARVTFDLPFSDEIIAEGDRIADEEGLRDANSVVLNIGSAQFSKIWPAASFRRLADVLTHDLNCKVVLMGANDFPPNKDYDLRMSREHFNDGSVINLVEKTSVAVDSYLLSSGVFNVAVGNDSFAGHMAGSASETSPATAGALEAGNGRWYVANHTVSLIGPTNPRFCRPYDPTDTFNSIVSPHPYPPDCVYDRKSHTCPHYGDSYCVERAHCMEQIGVDEVVAAVEAKLPPNVPASQ